MATKKKLTRQERKEAFDNGVVILFMCGSERVRNEIVQDLRAAFGKKVKGVEMIGQGRAPGDYAFKVVVEPPPLFGAQMVLSVPPTDQTSAGTEVTN